MSFLPFRGCKYKGKVFFPAKLSAFIFTFVFYLIQIMPQYPNRQFLNFEQPIKELYEQIDQTKKLAGKNPKINYESTIQQFEQSILEKRHELTEHLTPWQRVQLNHHPDRHIHSSTSKI